MAEYGTRIKKHRDRKGYSQDYMAERLGISQNAFHKIETGQTNLKANTLQQIADILEIEVMQLLKDDANKFKIRQISHDSSTGVTIYSDSFEEERNAWRSVESALRDSIEIQRLLIESLKETVALQQQLLSAK